MANACRHVVIVGGGSAGWIAAARLARALDINANPYSVTVIEAPDIQAVGVGEGTWPTMRRTLQKIGVSETDFIRACSASFKQGTKFIGWLDGGGTDQYYHPFEPPRGSDRYNVGEQWLNALPLDDGSFSKAVTPQEAVCEKGLAPKAIIHGEYKGLLNYGYHLDAAKLGAFLKKHATEKLGVHHVADTVLDARKSEDGWLEALITEKNGEIKGDFFIDCTGFRSLLMTRHMGVGFQNLQDILLVNKALAIQLPYREGRTSPASVTLSTAHPAGWIWDISLQDRRGLGIVYSSNHMDDDRAYGILQKYADIAPDAQPGKTIEFQARKLEQFWVKNAMAIGLAAGFVEPLEASALTMIEISVDWLCDRFPEDRDAMAAQSKTFNRTFDGYWQRIVEFLKFHYLLSKRTEKFWVDNRDSSTIPDSLQEKMALWRRCAPYDHDFVNASYVFSWQSFQYVYFGMHGHGGDKDRRATSAEFHNDCKINAVLTKKAIDILPENQEILDKIKEYGMKNV